MMQTRRYQLFFACAICLLTNAWGVSRFSNYSSVISVNDVLVNGRTVWVATSGGLYISDSITPFGRLESDVERFPDLRLISLARDSSGNLWVGSEKGYLTKVDQSGRYTLYSSYAASKWDIKKLFYAESHVLVASSRGFSIFDARKGQAVKNAVRFGTFRSSAVNAIAIDGDSLYLGGDEGIAHIGINGHWMDSLNFYDQSIWRVRPTAEPVICFIVKNGMVQGMSYPALYFRGKIVYTDSVRVYSDGVPAFQLPSRILCASTNGNTMCWFGTEEHYFYFWTGAGAPMQVTISGPTFRIVNKVYVDRGSNLYALPQVTPWPHTPWWQGVLYYGSNGAWFLNNSWSDPNFGWLGDNRLFSGFCQTRSGALYFGSPSGNVKCYDAGKGWRQYYVSGSNAYSGFRLLTPQENTQIMWGKCDAVAQDSSGYLWIASWNNYAGCLICYNPAVADPGPSDYKRFIPKDSPYFMEDVIALSVDKNGAIFAGSADGKLLIFRHDGNPLTRGISEILRFKSDLNTIYDITCHDREITWIACAKGLFRATVHGGAVALDSMDKLPGNITCAEQEADAAVWLGTTNAGLIRYNPQRQEKDEITTTQGLISNAINDVSIDYQKGYLWVATYDGLSRYDLMHADVILTDPGNLRLYPNPFSLSNPHHSQITFENLPANTRMHIADIKGSVVGVPAPFVQSEYEWVFRWAPPRSLLPGTYIAVAKSSTAGKTAKLMVVP
jgi:ligand-binding sensor domain-containing protein